MNWKNITLNCYISNLSLLSAKADLLDEELMAAIEKELPGIFLIFLFLLLPVKGLVS